MIFTYILIGDSVNNYLVYYYNLYPEHIYKLDNYLFFFNNGYKYCLINYEGNANDLNIIYNNNQNMLKMGIKVHEIIINKDKQIVTMVDNVPSLLLRLNIDDKRKICDEDLLLFIKMVQKITPEIIENKWTELWSNKIDYFEYQIEQNKKKYPIIHGASAYYIGLAENAISYVNDSKKELGNYNNDCSIVHKRVRSDDTFFELYNPLNLIVDIKVRDAAEYIKSLFFNRQDVWEFIQKYFDSEVLSPFSLRMFYARLMFPSYYFDFYEKIIIDQVEEDKIISIIELANQYEIFLKEIYLFILKYAPIPPINWLNKKTSN